MSILVIDLGSSSTRAVLFDVQAELIPGAMTRHPSQFNADNEDDPRAAVDRVNEVLAELTAKFPKGITDIGLSCYATSLIGLDENHEPVTPVLTYADARPAEDARALRLKFDEVETLQRTGCRIRSNYWPAKLTWLKRTQPDVFSRIRWFCSLADYVCWRVFGIFHTGISVASWTGLVNRQTNDWDETWLRVLNLQPDQLPSIDQQSATVKQGPWQGAQLHPPLGDGAAANIGSGCTDPSRVAVTIGTTAALRIVRETTDGGRPTIIKSPSSVVRRPSSHLPSALWEYRVDHTHALIGGATTEGGSVFAWAQRALKLGDEDAIERAVAQQKPDQHGLTVLPMFAGERSPGYAEDVRATLHGLSLDTSPEEMVRALLEAVAFRLALIHDSLREVAEPGAVLVGSGGALVNSSTWCQIIADVTNTPLSLSDEAEASAKGVALLVSGHMVSQPALSASRTFQPNPDHHKIYRAAMQRQQELYDKLV